VRASPADPVGCQIVISGAGLITCLGSTREEVFSAIAQGRCGVRPMSEVEAADARGQLGGQAVDLPAGSDACESRESAYLRYAAKTALVDAGFTTASDNRFDLPYPAARCGIIVGTTLHGMRSGGTFLRTGDPLALRQFLATSVLRAATGDLGLEGPALTNCSACSSSLGSIALAITLLQQGQLDLVLAGGYDPISEYAFGGFNSLRLVTPDRLRPFARDRQGMKVGEGYGFVVLERADDQHRRRKSAPLARVLGFGESADAHHLTQPHPQGDGAARAILAALKSADISPQQIDLIAAHATGTPDNDAAEYAALRRVFADDLSHIPVVGFKSHLSHNLGAAGCVELILSAMAIASQTVPPCASVTSADTDFEGLNLSTENVAPTRLKTAMNLSLGFGGANTCLIVAAPEFDNIIVNTEPSRPPSTFRNDEVLITGIGIVLPGAVGLDAFLKLLLEPKLPILHDEIEVPAEQLAPLLNARRARRLSAYVKYSLAATTLALRHAGIALPDASNGNTEFFDNCSAILGSTHCGVQYCVDYYRQIVEQGVAAANPMLFAEGVPNAAAAHLSLAFGLKGACQTIIGSRTAALDALGLAANRIASGQWQRAIVGASEEFCPVVKSAYEKCGPHVRHGSNGDSSKTSEVHDTPLGCGAITFILESRSSVQSRGGRVLGSIDAYAARSSREGHLPETAARLLADIGSPSIALSSSGNSRLDRVESAALKRGAHANRISTSPIEGKIAETFSVNSLAVAAAMLLRVHSSRAENEMQDATAGSFAVVAADYNGPVAAVRFSPASAIARIATVPIGAEVLA